MRLAAGILPVLKPPGPSSQQVVRAVAAMVGGGVRAGHAGTLDPAAAGVLLVGLGEATRILGFLQGGDKRYRFELVLGVETDTQDATGHVVRRRDTLGLGRADLERVLAEHVGRIRQRAPLHSARHVGGRRLYSYARQGEAVEAPEFEVDVHALRLLDFRAGTPALALCDLCCGAGTYVRALASAIGARLGTGGHAGMLLRLGAGGVTVDRCHTIEEIGQATSLGRLNTLVQTPAEALGFLPAVLLTRLEAERVRHGIAPVIAADGAPELVRLLGPDGDLVAVAARGGTGVQLRCVLAGPDRA